MAPKLPKRVDATRDASHHSTWETRTMRSHILKALGIAGAAMALATSAQAQGRGRDHDKNRDKQNNSVGRYDPDGHDRSGTIRRRDGDVVIAPRNDAGVPPGLAKKPGHMPPGQYKKRYTTLQGAN